MLCNSTMIVELTDASDQTFFLVFSAVLIKAKDTRGRSIGFRNLWFEETNMSSKRAKKKRLSDDYVYEYSSESGAYESLRDISKSLGEQYQCTVCQQIPKSRPIYQCTNEEKTDIVCRDCHKGPTCPTCENVLFRLVSNRSPPDFKSSEPPNQVSISIPYS